MNIGQAQCSGQIGTWLVPDVLLDGGDIGESRGVSSADIEHPVDARHVGCQSDHAGQVAGAAEHPQVAAEKVLRRGCGPLASSIAFSPGVDSLPPLFQFGTAQGAQGSLLELFVGEHEDTLRRSAPLAAATGECTPCNPMQDPFDLADRFLCKLRKVLT